MTEYKGGFPEEDVAWLKANKAVYNDADYSYEIKVSQQDTVYAVIVFVMVDGKVLCIIRNDSVRDYPKAYGKTAEEAYKTAKAQLYKYLSNIKIAYSLMNEMFEHMKNKKEKEIRNTENDEYEMLCKKYEELVKNIAPCRICGKKPKQFIAGDTAGIACEDDFSNNVNMDIKISNCKQTMKDMIEDVKSSIALIEAWNAKQIIK